MPGARRGEPAAGPSLLHSIKQVELAVRHRLDELLRPAGVTTVQYTALTVLERRADLSAAELARDSFVTAQSMADVVSALEGMGMVTRRQDARNRRRLVIDLTSQGRDLLADLEPAVSRLERLMVAQLSEPDVQRLRGYLTACRTALGGGEDD